jgi:HEAT repeat protein
MGLKDKEPEVKESAAKALAQIGWQPTTASEAAAYYLALQNWEKLVELGKPAVEYLIAGLETTHWTADVHKAAARALARITGEDFGVDADLWKQWWQKQK